MHSTDERREVAERLRALADGGSPMTECSVDSLYIALGVPCSCGTGIECAVIGYLADLIDPTCHRERKRVVVDDYRRDTLILPVCSACGFTFDKRMPKPNFCPHCGARLVERGER